MNVCSYFQGMIIALVCMNLAGERENDMQQSVWVFKNSHLCGRITWQVLSGWSNFLGNLLPNRLSLQTTKLCLQQGFANQLLTVMAAFILIFYGLSCFQHWTISGVLLSMCCVEWSQSKWSFSAVDGRDLQNGEKQNSFGVDLEVSNAI